MTEGFQIGGDCERVGKALCNQTLGAQSVVLAERKFDPLRLSDIREGWLQGSLARSEVACFSAHRFTSAEPLAVEADPGSCQAEGLRRRS